MMPRASLLLVAWSLASAPSRHPLHHYEATRMSMACVYAIEAYGPDANALPRIVDEAFDEVDRIDRLMSHYKADSPLSRVNREAARRPVAAALISAGGSTIYGLGAPPGRDGWDVTIQDPIDARKTALSVNLRDRALSVAGSSEKFFEAAGVRYSHIMDPRTGRPVQGVLSVAVLANSGTAGDALDDAFFVLGPERSRAYLNRLPGTEAMFFLPDASRGWTMVRLL